jgi:hypothetical protein
VTRGTYRRIAIALLLAAGLLLSPPAVSGGLWWDLGIACGYVAAVLLLCLYVFPVRGDGLPHARLFGLSQHRIIGWSVLALAGLHVAILWISQPQLWRYLVPSAPLFMWCGFVALLIAALLVQSGLSARTALRRTGSMRWPTTHIAVSALMVLLLGGHIAGSGQLSAGWFKTATLFLLLALPAGWFALRRRSPRPAAPAPRRITHLVAAAGLVLVPLPAAKSMLLEPLQRPAPIGITFPHEKHTSVNCVVCHHNYVDHTGMTACVECHRSTRRDLPHSSESTFHTFCRDCHAALAGESMHHGPARQCSACHQGTRSNSF